MLRIQLGDGVADRPLEHAQKLQAMMRWQETLLDY